MPPARSARVLACYPSRLDRLCRSRAIVAIPSLPPPFSLEPTLPVFVVPHVASLLCARYLRLSVALGRPHLSPFLSLALRSSLPSSLTGIPRRLLFIRSRRLSSPRRSSLAPRREYLSSPASAADVPLPVRPRHFARYPLSTWNVGVTFCVSASDPPSLFLSTKSSHRAGVLVSPSRLPSR